MNFTVPCDFRISTAEKIKELINNSKDKIGIEFYGSTNPSVFLGSGRGNSNSLPAIDLHKLKNYCEAIRDMGFTFNYTINSLNFNNIELTKSGAEYIVKWVKKLRDEVGIRKFTVSNVIIIKILLENIKDIEIIASTILGVNSYSEARYLSDLGVNKIVMHEKAIRNFALLSRISSFPNVDIELIVNNHCYHDCIVRSLHYNAMGNNELSENDYYFDYFTNDCTARNNYEYLKIPFIRPEDIDFYRSININNFKIEGRTNIDNSDIAKSLKSYINKSYEGNILELLYNFNVHFKDYYNGFKLDNRSLDGFIDKFLNDEYKCEIDCGISCDYCNVYLSNILNMDVNLNKMNKIRRLANRGFIEYGVIKRENVDCQKIMIEVGDFL